MKITHHPDPSTLMSFAAGSLPEALSAVVAAHIEMCTECAREVRDLDLVGAALFEHLDGAPMEASASAMPALALAPQPVAVQAEPGPASCIERLIGRELEDVNWRRLGFGVWHYPIKLSDNAEGDLRLIKVAPGQVLPEHGHGGTELTLLLDGAYRDEFGEYRRGDLSDLGDDVDHQPISDAKEGCICLIASDRRAKFRGFVSRIAQPFTGL